MPTNRPNILLVMNDDMGFSDIGCYGGEVQTPNLDGLAANGIRFTQFYNTARCCPTRASILTGLHPHQAGVGWMTADLDEDGYRGSLNDKCVTIAEALGPAGYATYMSGKWHVSRQVAPDGPKHSWPCQRGFDRYFGILGGAANYWQPRTLTQDNDAVDMAGLPEDFFLTDAISDHAADYIREHADSGTDDPFFLYTAYTSPHWPLHAHPADIERYRGRFAAGWDRLREERLQRMRAMGIVDASWPITDRDPTQPPWQEAPHKDWEQRRMEVYAAQIDRMDQGIGRIVAALEETDQIDNTLILFLADNGACAEEFAQEVQPLPSTYGAGTTHTRDGRMVLRGNDPTVMPGSEDTYQSYGVPWANLSNTPFREYKHWVHEGGIATPLIVHWPAAVADAGALRHGPGQLTDIMATCLDVAGADYPTQFNGNDIIPLEGSSLVPIFDDQPNHKEALIWEHEGNKAVRRGRWKLVCKHPGDWELYDIVANRTETEGARARASGDRGGTRRDPRCLGRTLRRQALGAHAETSEERNGDEREKVTTTRVGKIPSGRGLSRACPRPRGRFHTSRDMKHGTGQARPLRSLPDIRAGPAIWRYHGFPTRRRQVARERSVNGFKRHQIVACRFGVTLALLHAPVIAVEGGTLDPEYGFPKTAFEYAKMVEPQLGVPPRIDLGEGVEIPLYVDGVQKRGVLKTCDNPSRLGKGCISGSVLQRYEGRTREGEPLPGVVWVSFGRNSSLSYRGEVHVLGSVQMIGYDEWTGATAFFESSDLIDPWADVDPETFRLTGVMPWIDDPEAFNRAFRTPKIQCVECHQNDPFIHNSFIDAAMMPGTDEPVVPRVRTRDRDMRTDLPYFAIGGGHWDMRTIHIEGNGCLDCHRIGMGTAKLFMRYGWDPNEHMPPKDPGSLSEDWEELQACWERSPEKTPGCDWVVPPTGDALGRVVGEDYPNKARFNQVGREALSLPATGDGGLKQKFGAKPGVKKPRNKDKR